MLIVLALLFCLFAIALVASSFIPAGPGQLPLNSTVKWVLWYSAALNVFIIAVIVATIVFRARSRSDACLIWTKAVNILLLLVFPFGTIVGIYGLWKLDKPAKSSVS
jgi:hypothetical protein